MQNNIEIFTDGSCLGNPGPGGYGILLRYSNYEKILSAGYRFTTNNRMELMAAIIALEALTKPANVLISTDSKYLREGITTWINTWKKNNWKRNNKTLVKNVDLWQRLEIMLKIHTINWTWIKSHTGHPDNERCDGLAKYAAYHNPFLEDVGYNDSKINLNIIDTN